MREILFRRCRLEIEPSGIIRMAGPGGQLAEMRAPNDRPFATEAAAHGYDDLTQYFTHRMIATLWLLDLFDTDFAKVDDVEHLLKNEPLPGAGAWDEMARFWFTRTRDGWPLLEHGQALNAATWTSFLASAIKADRDDNNQHTGRDARNDEEDVGRAD